LDVVVIVLVLSLLPKIGHPRFLVFVCW